MSRMSAPAAAIASARASASGSPRCRPPSEKLSGVTFSTPISRGRSSVRPQTGARGAARRSTVSAGTAATGTNRGSAPRRCSASCANQSGPPASGTAPAGRGPPPIAIGR